MILVIDDDEAVRVSLSIFLKKSGFSVKAVSNVVDGNEIISKTLPELIILDMNFSASTTGQDGLNYLKEIRKRNIHIPVILLTGWGNVELAVSGMKLGATDFLTKPWNNENLLHVVRTSLNLTESKSETPSRKLLDSQYDFKNIIGESPKLLDILSTVGRIALTEASVLITGESGTGKELIAEAIHKNSARKNFPFIKVNLGGISSSLFESELFGHVHGSFTGAKGERIGRFSLADKGTIFLDEIGELDLGSQVKLLRVLQDRTFEPLGSSNSRVVDVRVISATNRNLNEMVRKGQFREDLLYRINLISLRLPAIRERPCDISKLITFFLKNLRKSYGRPNIEITDEALTWFIRQNLPGNIRQLKNLVERSVLLSDNDKLSIEDFAKHITDTSNSIDFQDLHTAELSTLEDVEFRTIKKAMELHNGNLVQVATSLGITRFSLYRRLDKYGFNNDSTSI